MSNYSPFSAFCLNGDEIVSPSKFMYMTKTLPPKQFHNQFYFLIFFFSSYHYLIFIITDLEGIKSYGRKILLSEITGNTFTRKKEINGTWISGESSNCRDSVDFN